MSSKTKDKEASEKQSPIKIIRSGAIAASIWKRQTQTGFEYLDFSLSRSWKLKDGEREGYSGSFFERNESALVDVITKAAEFIRTHSASEPEVDRPMNPKRAGGHEASKAAVVV